MVQQKHRQYARLRWYRILVCRDLDLVICRLSLGRR
jgi:hypothetical protein